MKYNILLFILLACTTLTSCHSKKKTTDTPPPAVLNEQTVTQFAKNIAKAIVMGNAAALNDAFDKTYLREVVSQNSIVYSSFDIEAGKKYFETGLLQGTLAVEAVNNGGDFAFVKYYNQNHQHHVIFRAYNDYNLSFVDYVVDTVGGKLKIKDGFMFNTGAMLSKNLQSGMLYNLMLQTNPEGEVKNLRKAELLTEHNKNREALKLLRENKNVLKDYVLYWQLYIANLYKTDPTHFVAQLDALTADSLDTRYLLLHKLLYYFNAGNADATEEIINEMIPYSGDDPIFLLFVGKAHIYAKEYAEALECLKYADQSLPLLWDLWNSELQCYYALKDNAGFDKCLQRGQKAYGMSPQELQELKKGFSAKRN